MSLDHRYHPEWETVSRYVRELFNYHCSRCEKNCRNNKNPQMVLQVHHIDENPLNNKLENLIPLCASCHLKIESEARLHAPNCEKQLELFEDYTYTTMMKEMRINALIKFGSQVNTDLVNLDEEIFENIAIEWEINEEN